MFFGPLVSLEMVTSARRARYYIVRVVYAAALFGLLWFIYEETSRSAWSNSRAALNIDDISRLSFQFFVAFSYAQLVAVFLLTPAMIAGSIAQERERRTIEYLFASTLTDREIVFSKFLSRLLQVAGQLLVGLPILAIAMMLGGIQPALLLAVFAVTLATLVATAGVSMAVSVWAKRSRDAVVQTYLLVLVFLCIPPLAWGLSQEPQLWNWLRAALAFVGTARVFNSFHVLNELLQLRGSAGGAVVSHWWSIVPMLIASTFCAVATLVWSTVWIRAAYRRSVSEVVARPRRFLWRRRRRAVGDKPMLWKELFSPTAALKLGVLGRIAAMLLFAATIIPAFVTFLQEIGTYNHNHGGFSVLLASSASTVTLLECAALAVVAIRAAGSITAEKERDSWLTLISTTLTPREIIWAKVAGSIYAVRWFALPIGIWWSLIAVLHPTYLAAMPVLMGSFVCIAWAVAAIGVWYSSWCSTSVRAMASTVATCMILGGGYLLCCMPLFVGTNDESILIVFAPCIPFLLGSPTFFWMQSFWQGQPHSPGESILLLAFFLGIVGYIMVGAAMMGMNVNDFDLRAGRPTKRSSDTEPSKQPPTPGDQGASPETIA